MLAISSSIAFAIDPQGRTEYGGAAFTCLLGYTIYAVCLVAAARIRPAFPRESLPWILHAVDVGWITAITLMTGGPGSPFLGLFGFALLSAAYRWGLRETIATAMVVIALLLVPALIVTRSGPPPFGARRVDGNLTMLWAVYLLVDGVLVGYLTQQAGHLRAEASTVTRIMDQIRPEAEPEKALEGALAELLAAFDAKTALLVVRDQSHGGLHRWDAHAPPGVSHAELGPVDEVTYLFPTPAESWYAVERESDAGGFEAFSLYPDTNRPRQVSVSFPASFLAAHKFQSLLVLSTESSEASANRLFLFDARVGVRALRFLQTIARQTGPAIHSVELLGRLRSRAGAAERARVARDLHDGIIQSLIGLEMQVDVWRREAEASDSPAAEKLARIQDRLRIEVLDVRDLMQQMKPVPVDPKLVLEHLAHLVERFQRDSGIASHFVSDIDDLTLSPRICDEVVRIVQEALVNVRKHSGARNVLVRVSAPNGCWKFEIDDDGRGFGFAGRRSQAELDLERKGPVMIKERVRAIRGQLAVESNPGQGARIEVSLSRDPHG